MIVSLDGSLRIEGSEVEVLTETTGILTCIYENLTEKVNEKYARGKLLEMLVTSIGMLPEETPAS